MYDLQLNQFKKMLKNLDNCLAKAAAHSDAKKFDVNNFVECRLIADMFPLVKQVQSSCDSAKFFAARLAGKEAPKHEDNEKTFAELRERIKKVLTYLETFSAKDFANAKNLRVSPGWAQGKWMTADEFAHEVSVPNFFFHVTTAYAILRTNGVDVGKMDYLGSVDLKD